MQAATRKSVPLTVVVLTLALFSSACSSSREGRESAALDEALASFIDGDYELAEERLQVVLAESPKGADEVRATAYLYLGRCCIEQGRYEDAADAFMQGRLYGDVERFNAYLLEVSQHLGADASALKRGARLTRAQLAVQLHETFATRLDGDAGAALPADAQGHWASEHISVVLDGGLMRVLPDGGFHPDAYVTRAAFVASMLELSIRLDVARPYDAGYERELSDPEVAYVTGAEALNALQLLAERAGVVQQ